MLSSDNIQHALLFKRRMEISRFEAKINRISKEEKKALVSNYHHKSEFVQQSKSKRKEWWKADKSFREMIKKNVDSKFSNRSNSTLASNQAKLKEINSLEDFAKILINKSIEICTKSNSNKYEKPIRNIISDQKVSFIRIGSGESSASLMKSCVEPLSILHQEEKNDWLFPMISTSSKNDSVINSNKKYDQKNKISQKKLRDNYDYTFNRFLTNSPFIVENKSYIKKFERQLSFVNHQVKIHKITAGKRDIRFDNLINCLNTIG